MKIKYFIKSIIKILKDFVKRFLNNIDFLLKTVIIVLPSIFLYICKESGLAIAQLFINLFCVLLIKVFNSYNSKCNGFPICKKRFTQKSNINDKVICVKNEDMIQAIRYLYDVENYAERNGLK